MKILFVTPYYKPYLGGIERVIEKMSKELQSQDHDVFVLTTKFEFPNSPGQKRVLHDDWLSQEVSDTGEQVYRLSSFPKTAPSFYQVPLVWFSPLQIRKIIKEIQPDVIQLMGDRWFWGNFFSALFSSNAKVVFAVIFHELNHGKENRLFPWLLKQALRPINALIGYMSDWVHVVTNLEAEMVRKAYGITKTKIKVIPWGVDFTDTPAQHDSTVSNGVTVLAVGRISEHKGQKWLAEIVKEIANILHKNITLVLVGKDDGIGEDLKKMYADDSLLTLQLPGAISDDALGEQYQKADIFALFPEYESFGLVYMEAMSYGLPVLTHDVGAVKEVLGDYAEVISAYNAAQAKVVLTRLVEDESYRKDLGDKGNKYVRSTFSWQKTVQKFMNEYTNK